MGWSIPATYQGVFKRVMKWPFLATQYSQFGQALFLPYLQQFKESDFKNFLGDGGGMMVVL